MAELSKDWHNEKTELVLYADNESSLYPQKKSIIANAKDKIERGVYDKAKAPDLWIYWVDAAAKKYCKEFGCEIIRTFPIQVRKAAAAEIAEREYDAIMSGEYGPVEVKQPKTPKTRQSKGKPKLPKLELTRKKINRQGYDSNGRYYGIGEPLFAAFNPDTREWVELRSPDRKTALEIVKRMFTEPTHKSVAERFTHGQIKTFTGNG